MKDRSTSLLLKTLTVALACAATSAIAAGPTPIFTTVTSSPTSLVPGGGGIRFTSFDRPFGSTNGNWLILCDTDAVTTSDGVVMMKQNANPIGIAVREGDTLGLPAGETHGTFQTYMGINNAGDWAFGVNADGTAPTAADQYIMSVTAGGTASVVAKEGSAAGTTGVNYSLTLNAAHIQSNGQIGFKGTLSGATATNQALFQNTSPNYTTFAQKGVTVPGSQTGTPQLINTFLDNQYFTSANGANSLYRATLAGPTATDNVVVFNGNVVLQEGVDGPTASASLMVSTNLQAYMDQAGNWFARGSNADTIDWVVRNGTLIAEIDQPVIGGPELWDDASFPAGFFLTAGNSLGNYIVGGVTNNADPLLNGVLVYNGSQVVVRESDPVDLDNNGLFDDNVFFNTFGNDDAFLDDFNVLHFTASLKDGTGAAVGTGYFSMVVPEPGSIALLLIGGMLLANRRR